MLIIIFPYVHIFSRLRNPFGEVYHGLPWFTHKDQVPKKSKKPAGFSTVPPGPARRLGPTVCASPVPWFDPMGTASAVAQQVLKNSRGAKCAKILTEKSD